MQGKSQLNLVTIHRQKLIQSSRECVINSVFSACPRQLDSRGTESDCFYVMKRSNSPRQRRSVRFQSATEISGHSLISTPHLFSSYTLGDAKFLLSRWDDKRAPPLLLPVPGTAPPAQAGMNAARGMTTGTHARRHGTALSRSDPSK